MRNFLRQNGIILLIIAALISVMIWLGSALLGGNVDPLSTVANTVTAPIRSGVSAVLNWAENVYAYVFHYDELHTELDELRTRVAELEDIVRKTEETRRENEELRALLDLSERRADFVFEPAKVTNRSTSNWESTLMLSKGSAAGVSVGQCVVTSTGTLVGTVSEVGPNWATVSTVINTDLEMGGIIARTYAAGILEGDFALMGEGKLKMTYLPDSAQLISGDEVLTSGKGDIYPAGLVVGRVEGVFTDPSGQSRYATVVPKAQLDELIEVFVIKEFDVAE